MRYEAQNHIDTFLERGSSLSVAWALPGGKTVVRGSYGWFYDRFESGYILQAERQNGITQKQYIVNNPTMKVSAISPTGAAITPTLNEVAPDLHAPPTMHGAVGVDRRTRGGFHSAEVASHAERS